MLSTSGAQIGKIVSAMWCPRCKSSRIQRGYSDTLVVLRIAGLHQLLCNNCGLDFKGFDPLRRLERVPSKRRESSPNQRRCPRFKTHLPATICLVERNALTWDVAYTQRSRGHCETISQIGMALSFVGTRFSKEQITLPGCSLFVTLDLPDGAISAVVSIVNWSRTSGEGRPKWLVGTMISQMSESNTARLAAYLKKRGEAGPHLAFE